jgi:putative SOS response-associated peptidase YedK
MCGRFALFSSMDAIKNYYKELVIKGKIEPNYNIVPSMIVPIVIKSFKGYRLFNLKWGFVPYWSDKKGFINIRAETINTKNSFKYALKIDAA